ncbi:MAG: sigma-E processing peptidase SpoIIGA [Ruminococcus sp.]|nr:sigma-E processing peptidase SpoIIGA [Ruminococcus sp.]
MKTVYVDVMIFTNIFEDFLLLCAVKYILRIKTKYYRLVLGSLAGGIMSVLSLINLNFIISVLLKILSALLLILIAFGFKDKKLFIKSSSTLIVITFLVNGAIICFYIALKPNGMLIINDSVYFDISPLLLIILTLVVYIILFLYKKLFKNHAKTNLVKDVEIKLNNSAFIIKCKVDSGLNAKEPFSGSSVIIVEKSVFNESVNEKNLRVIPFKSLGGEGIIYGFKAENVIIDRKTINEEIYIGMYEGKFNNEIKGLLPESIGE